MKPIFLAFLISSLCITSVAQEISWPETNGRKTVSAEDSLRIHVLINRGMKFVNTNTDSAFKLIRRAEAMSQQSYYNDGTALAHLALATCYAVNNDIVTADAALQQAYPYCLRSANKAELLIKWYQSRFIVFKYAGFTDSALLMLRKALPLAEAFKDSGYLVNLYNHIGSILIDNQDYQNAEGYIWKAKEMNRRKDVELLVSNINLGYVYAETGKPDSMYVVASQAYEAAASMEYPRYERSASLLLVRYFLESGDERRADDFAKNAIRLIDSYSSDNKLYTFHVLCVTYMKAGYYHRALTYGQEAYAYIQPSQRARKNVVHLFSDMAEIYHALGDPIQAYDWLRRYNQLSDSLHATERNAAIDRLEKQFQLSEKEKQIARKENLVLIQQDKVRRRNVWMAIMGVSGLGLLALLIVLQRINRKKMQIMRQQEEIRQLRAMMEGEEKERNRIAMDLHDNIGGLISAAAYGLDSVQKEHQIPQDSTGFNRIRSLVAEAGQEIRHTAQVLMPDVLLRYTLPEAIRVYAASIEQDSGVEIDVQDQGTFDRLPKDVQLSLYRIVQELIQNVLKHAEASGILVQLHAGTHLVSLTVEDDGRGFPEEGQKGQRSGMGLSNIEARLKVLGGTVHFDSTPGRGTSVYIEIPV